MHRGHLRSMSVAGVVILAGLALAGVPLARAGQYALFLACPLSMVVMMWTMNRGRGAGGTCHGGTCHGDHQREQDRQEAQDHDEAQDHQNRQDAPRVPLDERRRHG